MECVVEAGCVTILLVSPKLAVNENNSNWSKNLFANEKIGTIVEHELFNAWNTDKCLVEQTDYQHMQQHMQQMVIETKREIDFLSSTLGRTVIW